MTETVPPGNHASNGAAEVTAKVIRQQANLLIDQMEKVAVLNKSSAVIILFITGHYCIVHGYTTVLSYDEVPHHMSFVPAECTQVFWRFLEKVFWVFCKGPQKGHHNGRKGYG